MPLLVRDQAMVSSPLLKALIHLILRTSANVAGHTPSSSTSTSSSSSSSSSAAAAAASLAMTTTVAQVSAGIALLDTIVQRAMR